jgi:signal transduction histidine kinase
LHAELMLPDREDAAGTASEASSARRSAVAASVLFVLGVALSVAGWWGLTSARDRALERDTSAVARAVAELCGQRVADDVEGLRQQAEAWTTNRPGFPIAAAGFLAQHPGFTAIAALHDGEIAEITGPAASEGEVRDLAARVRAVGAASDTGERARMIGPIRSSEGRTVFGIEFSSQSSRDRTLLALLDPARMLGRILEGRARGFEITVSAAGVGLFRQDTASTSIEHREEVSHLPGESWTLTARPTDQTVDLYHGGLPTAVLLGGCLVAALASSLFHVGNLSRMRARALQQTNAQLDQRITHTRREERQVRLLKDALERHVEERTAVLNETIAELETFNYSVSHDLRSPLGAVVNFAAILQEDYGSQLDDKGRAIFGRLVSSAKTAVRLMDGLLAFSRSGRSPMEKERVSMRAIATDVVREISSSRDPASFDVRVDDLPDAWADRAMMRVVFLNLIDNACKFARKGEAACVEVGAESKPSETRYFVRDHGVGFDMRYAGRLFKPFERLGPADRAGTGVGLAIAERLVKRHGGRLEAHGAPGEGATFTFTLPHGGTA